MKITMYGTRGSIPTPSTKKQSTVEFGGNTTCIYLEADDGTKHIIDAGSGIRVLGLDMLRDGYNGKSGKKASLYISHTHWDHIQGLPFFAPAYIPGNDIHIYGEAKIKINGGSRTNLRMEHDLERTMNGHSDAPSLLLSVDDIGLRKTLEYQQNSRNFPASLDMLAGITQYYDFMPETGAIYLSDTLRVETMNVNHPGGCIAYRFTEYKKDGTTAIAIVNTDFEPELGWLKKMTNWWNNADIVIADGQYEPETSTTGINTFKKGWGHSDFETDLDIAKLAGAKKLLLTHHEPTMDDSYHLDLENRAKMYSKAGDYNVKVELAREGLSYII